MASACYSCILDRAKFEGDLVFGEDEQRKLEAVEELLEFMACHKSNIPALVGTERERIIKRRSGNPDPYRALKAESNLVARELQPLAMNFYEQAEEKLEALIRIAAAANSMEFGVKGHDFQNATFGQAFEETLAGSLDGDLGEVQLRLRRFQRILYLTDNAGEVVFDLLVAEKLEGMGKRLVMAAKSEPVLNDVTAEELREMTEIEVIETGAVVGTTLEELSPKAAKFLFDPNWLVLAKGMGNFETLSEFQDRLKGRLIYVLRAKCEPVARALGVARGSLVVRSV